MDPRRALSAPRRVFLRTQAAIWLPTLVAVLSFATGVANISVADPSGPLADLIPASVQAAAGFTGTLTGFLMLTSAAGMRRRLRAAWISTVVLLPVTALQGLVQSSRFSLPLVALSLLSLPTVLLNYRRFDRRLDLTATQLAAIAALTGTLVYGTAGTYALREQFTGVFTLTDALYYTVVTASTVGYGDVTPMQPYGQARLFGLSVVLLGTASFALALGSVLGPAIESRLSQALGTMTDSQLELLEDHVVVLGYGDLTEPLLEELAGTVEFVVITPDSDVAAELRTEDVHVLTGDPSDEEPQESAAIHHASAVIAATNDDAQDALAILTARELNPDVRIVAAATDRENTTKLRRAGADAVISPAVIGGHMLVESALGTGDMEGLADRILGTADGDGIGDAE
jgi:voltage-gated potassium channel